MKQEITFEGAIAKLEETVKALESGSLSLSESLDAYSEAIRLSRSCTEMLEGAEAKIRILQKSADGSAVEVPFEDGSDS